RAAQNYSFDAQQIDHAGDRDAYRSASSLEHHRRKVIAIPGLECQISCRKILLHRQPRQRRRRVAVQAFTRAPDNIWTRSDSLQTAQVAADAFRTIGINGDMADFSGTP